MDEQQLAAFAAAWAEIEAGEDYGPDHCADCAAQWAVIMQGIPALVAYVRLLRQAAAGWDGPPP